MYINELYHYRLRNFRTKTIDGIKRYFVKVQKEWIEVDASIYKVMDSSIAHELYQYKIEHDMGFFSIDSLLEKQTDDSCSSILGVAESAENIGVEILQNEEMIKYFSLLKEAIDTLEERERYIIKSYYFEEKSKRSLAKEFNRSRNTIDFWMNKAFTKIKQRMPEDQIKKWRRAIHE